MDRQRAARGVRVANAPLSYGAFEMTVGTAFPVPDPEQVLAAIGDAGYAGTDLGPPGYLGEGAALAERLDASRLELVGGFVPFPFSERDHWEEGMAGLRHTLDLFAAAGAAGARPVLCDAGGPERVANPGRGGEDPSLRLSGDRWRTLVEGVERAADASRERGFEPVFHHHTSTYVEAVGEIERLLEDSDVALLLDSGHIAVAGGDPVTALADWGERIGAVHVKDVRLGVLERVKAERADTLTAWRRGLFCALGDGDVDLDGFFAALEGGGYEGWVVVEQDRVLESGEAFGDASAEQARNREWLREHAGW
jgi:inosose dehydratase